MNKKIGKIKVYLIGVGGSGMSAICKFLLKRKFVVYGSDKVLSRGIEDLISLGLKFNLGHDSDAVSLADIVVFSSAISEENKELILAKSLRKTIYKRSELLSVILSIHKRSVGVCGSHGKTTATTMLSKVLIDNKIFANCFIGGNYPLKNFESKNGVAIAEVCEFNKNIGDIKTDFSICLNVDNDHLDSYGSLDNLKGYFFDYLDRSKLKFLNADDKILSLYKSDNIISFSIDATSDYKADNLVENNGRYSFDVFERGIFKTRLTLGVLGKHNVYNALSVISISREVFKLDYDKIIKPLCDFSGVERRFQNIGELLDKQIICDYAHHPTELGYTIKTAKELLENDYLIVFQPHTYSRTKLLFNDFIRVLKGENLVIYKEYPSREEYSFEGSSLRLAGELGCEYIDNFESLKEKIGKATVKTVLIIGAGDLYDKVLGEIKNG